MSASALEAVFEKHGFLMLIDDERGPIVTLRNDVPWSIHAPTFYFLESRTFLAICRSREPSRRPLFERRIVETSKLSREDIYDIFLQEWKLKKGEDLVSMFDTGWGARCAIENRVADVDPQIVQALAHEMSALLQRYGLEGAQPFRVQKPSGDDFNTVRNDWQRARRNDRR